jgi:hypothetical protein
MERAAREKVVSSYTWERLVAELEQHLSATK